MWGIKLENTAFLDLFNFASISSFLNDDFFSLQNDNWKWLEYLDGVDIVFVSSLSVIWFVFVPVILQEEKSCSSLCVRDSSHAIDSPIHISFFKFHYDVRYCSELLMIVIDFHIELMRAYPHLSIVILTGSSCQRWAEKIWERLLSEMHCPG